MKIQSNRTEHKTKVNKHAGKHDVPECMYTHAGLDGHNQADPDTSAASFTKSSWRQPCSQRMARHLHSSIDEQQH